MKTESRSSRLVFLPNLLSILRFPLALAFFFIEDTMLRGVILSVSALSDALDGWLARQFALKTVAGQTLDPLFDKLFVIIALAAFISGPYIGWVDYAVLVARDVYVGLAYLLARLMGVAVSSRARLGGKLVTLLQMVTLFVLLLAPDLISYCVIAVGLAGGAAIIDYTLAAVRYARSADAAA